MEYIMTLVLLISIALLIPMFARSYIWSRFIKALNNRDKEGALKELNSTPYKIFMGDYSRQFNTLKLYIATDDKKNIKEQTNKLLYSDLKENEVYQVCSNTYFYFLMEEDKEMCDMLLEKLDGCTQGEQNEYFHMLYRVLIEKKSDDIEFVEKILEAQEKDLKRPENKGQLSILQYLMGLQYSYKKDRKEADRWLNRAKENAEGSPLQNRIKKMLH